MRYVLILDAALLALAATMAMVLAVVCLLYGLHSELSVRIGAEMPTLITATLVFAFMAAFIGAAFWALLRRVAWRWWAQASAAVAFVFGGLFLYRLFTA